MRKTSILLAGVALVAATPVLAATSIYTDLASFNAATSAQATDTFDKLASSTGVAAPLTRTMGSYGYVASVNDPFFYTPTFGSDVTLGTNRPQETITFSQFTGGVFGIGGNFFSTDIGDAVIPSTINFTFIDAKGTTSQSFTASTMSSFIGFVSTVPVTSLSFTSPTSGAYVSANNLVLASAAATAAVPEPSTWAMMIVGFALAGLALRRARKSGEAGLAAAIA